MLVNGIFGVIIKVGTLCCFQNESFDDFFFKCFGPNVYILPENRFSTLSLCGSGWTPVYTIYTYTEEETELLTHSL